MKGEERRMKRILPIIYSLAFGACEDGFKRVAAAEARTVVPRSFVLAAMKRNRSSQKSATQERKVKRVPSGKEGGVK